MTIADKPAAGISGDPAPGQGPDRTAKSELEQARSRDFAWFNLSPVGHAVLDQHHRIRELNLAAAELLGLQRRRAQGQPLARFVVEESAEVLRRHLEDLFASGRSVGVDVRLRPLAGEVRDVHLESRILEGEIGDEPWCLCVWVDITDRQRAQERTHASLREKEVMLKEIHHRVKNNLQVICSLFSMQSRRTESPKAREVCQQCSDRVRSMAVLHEKLYQSADLSRIEFGEYLRDLVAMVSRAYRSRTSEVRITCEAAPLQLEIDYAIPLGLIATELMANSLKHAFPHHRAGLITVCLAEPRPSEYALAVRDDGVGLPPDFSWEHNRSLGLRLVRILTQQLRGRIESSGPPGTAFTLHFRHPAPEKATADEPLETDAHPGR